MRISFQNNIYSYKYNFPQSFCSSVIVANNPQDVVDISSDVNTPTHIGLKDKFVNIIHQLFNKNDEIYECERIEGEPLRGFFKSNSPIISEAKKILDKKPQFTVDDYRNLTRKERAILDKASYVLLYLHEGSKRTIKSDFEQIDKVANGFLQLLNKKYPNGYSVLAIGSSPSVISDIFSLNGIEVKTIPYSRNLSEKSFGYVKKHRKQYFDKVGLDSKYVSDSKKIIVMDYYVTGLSLQKFKSLLRYNFGRDKYLLKFDTQTLNRLLRELPDVTSEFMSVFEENYWNRVFIGSYSYVPKIENKCVFKNFINGKLEFKPSVTAKLMHYLIYKKYL